ncbi:MAG: hypothetical protein FJ399_12890 [Verrucomicrobia bacterium]|nr:hypothetical protein [Verrucomicrobiota bacterium]
MFFGRLRGLTLLALLYLVAALLLTGGTYLLLRRFFVTTTADCADTSWPVAERPSLPFVGAAEGGKNERTDEREERLFIAEFQPQLGSQFMALQFRNHEFARRVLEANGAGHVHVRHIAKAF